MKKHIKIFIFLFILLSSSLSAQQSKIDSLFTELKKWQNKTGYQADTTLYKIYYTLGVLFQNTNPDTAIYFLKESINKAKINNDAIKEAQSINLMGWCYYVKGDYNLAMQQYELALKVLPGKVNEKEKIRKQKVYVAIIGNIGGIYWSHGNYAKALEYYFKALKINEEVGNKKDQAANLGNIGLVYHSQGNYAKALEYYFKALKINDEIGNKQGQAINLGNIGDLYIKQKKYKEAEEYLKKAIEIGEELHIIYELQSFYNSLSELYSKTGRYKDALEAYKKHVMWKDSVNSEENKKALATKEMEYLFEKKQAEEQAKHQLEITKKEEENRRQRIIIFSTGILLVTMGIFLWRINKQKQIIEKQKQIVEEQKRLVDEKNKEIIDSIHYAKRIQQAILPDDDEWKRLLPDSFVLYLPKDIVAGDFYYLVEAENYIYVAAADSTGHGVPGAMVSVTCHNALNKAVLEEGLQNTNEILNRTREIVIKQLHSHQHSQLQDGMDICLVRINKSNRLQIQYSGANRSLVVINNGELKEYPPDKQPIGYYEGATPFNAQDIEIAKGSYLYLFTDGYADQFGGEKNKKLGTKRWKEMLLELAKKPTEEQIEYLRDFFQRWKGDNFQTDDVTVIGIRC
jgi:tetratricopeptide (TPR) repeat protein